MGAAVDQFHRIVAPEPVQRSRSIPIEHGALRFISAPPPPGCVSTNRSCGGWSPESSWHSPLVAFDPKWPTGGPRRSRCPPLNESGCNVKSPRKPVRCSTPTSSRNQGVSSYEGGEVRECPRRRKHQQSRVVRDQIKPLLLRLPANPPVVRTTLEGRVLPRRQTRPLPPEGRNMAQPRQTAKPEIVVHQRSGRSSGFANLGQTLPELRRESDRTRCACEPTSPHHDNSSAGKPAKTAKKSPHTNPRPPKPRCCLEKQTEFSVGPSRVRGRAICVPDGAVISDRAATATRT